MSKIDELIKKVEYDIKEFNEPMTYQDAEYYAKCAANLEYATEILSYLKDIEQELKNTEQEQYDKETFKLITGD